jgi:hypothetical protein
MRVRLLIIATALAPLPLAAAQEPQNTNAQAIVQQAVNAELSAERTDHSLWHFRMIEKEENDTVYDVVDTAQGEVKRKVEIAGQPLTPDQQKAEADKVHRFLTDPSEQARQRRDGEHDDKSAEKMLNLLPHAFLWSVSSTQGDFITLHFVPNPNYHAPDIESRVFSVMIGDLVVDRQQHRIRTIRGKLSQDVNIGFGVLGKLRAGGTFDVERRQLAPGCWQIVETHVHIDGRALLFKTIGQQTDEVKSDFHPIPQSTTLDQAAVLIASR